MVESLRRVGTLIQRLAIASAFVAVAACSSTPKPPPPTILQVQIDATANVNPDSRNRPSPVVVRFYELKTGAQFNTADFFSLWDKEKEVLGAELVAREEFQLAPGAQKKFDRNTQPDTKLIGVVAAYRDLERSNWRGTYTVVPNKTQALVIKLDARALAISGK